MYYSTNVDVIDITKLSVRGGLPSACLGTKRTYVVTCNAYVIINYCHFGILCVHIHRALRDCSSCDLSAKLANPLAYPEAPKMRVWILGLLAFLFICGQASSCELTKNHSGIVSLPAALPLGWFYRVSPLTY